MTTCWTCSGSTSARSSAALMAMPPSSVASTDERPPPSLPIGVRAAPRMTVLGMSHEASDVAWPADATPSADHRRPRRHRGRHDRRRRVRRRGRRARRRRRRAPARCSTPARRARPFKHLAVTHADGRRWMLVGLGRRDAFDAERARVAAAAVARPRARAGRPRRCAGSCPTTSPTRVAAALVEGTVLAAYRFDRYSGAAERRAARRRGARRVAATTTSHAAAERGAIVAEAQPTARATCRTRRPTT